MLIEKKELSVNDVAVIRLVTGEELVGKVVAASASDITITKPVILQMQMINPKEAGIGFAPFMVGAEEAGRYTFPHDKLVLLPMKARQDIAINYLKATTGLTMPPGANTASGLIT
jgi:hypothetical protein